MRKVRKMYGTLICTLILIFLTLGQINGAEYQTKTKYDPESPLVVEIASNLRRATDLQTAENIWDWMNQNIEYEKNNKTGVENTIREGKGQCSQQAYLAASLLLAAGWKPENVRIGDGNGHAWVEIYTDRWHRYDTVYTHSFEYEYSLPIYQEGIDYNHIDYYYYDTRETSKIVLVEKNIALSGYTHEISLKVENQGGTEKYVRLAFFYVERSNIIIEYLSHTESFLLNPGQEVTIEIYLKGEGPIRIEIDEISLEMTLIYPTYLSEQNPSSEKHIIQIEENESQSSLSEFQPETLPSQTPGPEKTSKMLGKIPKIEEIEEIELNSENQSENTIPREPSSSKIPFLFLPFLVIPLLVTLIFVKKRSNQMVECPFCENKIGKDWDRCPFCETPSNDTRIY